MQSTLPLTSPGCRQVSLRLSIPQTLVTSRPTSPLNLLSLGFSSGCHSLGRVSPTCSHFRFPVAAILQAGFLPSTSQGWCQVSRRLSKLQTSLPHPFHLGFQMAAILYAGYSPVDQPRSLPGKLTSVEPALTWAFQWLIFLRQGFSHPPAKVGARVVSRD